MDTIDRRKVRPSGIAGQWYPGSQRALEATLDGFFGQVRQGPVEGELVGLIAPHAGYAYSGQTAAYAYKQLQGREFDAVVVISPIHQWAFGLGSYNVTEKAYYETPLGLVGVDEELVAALDKEAGIKRIGRESEHSLEIQLPFLQYMLGEFTMLPIMMGASAHDQGGMEECRALGQALANALTGKTALLVASTDLSHLNDYDEVVRIDSHTAKLVDAFDVDGMGEALIAGRSQACGGAAVMAMLTAAQALGANAAKVLHHTNSGDVTGMRAPGNYTVGYLAAAVYRTG